MRKITILTLMAVAVLGALVLTSGKAEAAKENICHATGSVTNPYEAINVAENNSTHDLHLADFPYEGPEEQNGHPDNDKAVSDKWCEDNIPEDIEDLCDNIDGVQPIVPDGYVEENGICTLGGQGGNGGTDPETPVTPETPVVTPTASTISTLPYTGNGLLEVLSALGLSAAALVATYFASVKSFKFLNK